MVGLLSLPLPFPAFAPTLFKPLPLPFKSAELPLPITKYNRYKLYALLIINIVQAHICTMYILFVQKILNASCQRYQQLAGIIICIACDFAMQVLCR